MEPTPAHALVLDDDRTEETKIEPGEAEEVDRNTGADKGVSVDKFNEGLLLLQDEFRSIAQGHVRKIVEFVDSGETLTVQQLREIAHQIRGSAAIFGFPTLGEAAGSLDDHLGEYLNTKERWRTLDDLETCICDLRAVAVDLRANSRC